MDKSQNNEQLDNDILECKADILRAKDIIPPFGKKRDPKPNPKDQNTAYEVIEKHKEKVTQIRTDSKKTQPQQNQVPKFDLAKEIMVEQRKVSSRNRKGPGKDVKPQQPKARLHSSSYAIRQPEAISKGHGRVITDIVARDIKKLCRSGNALAKR